MQMCGSSYLFFVWNRYLDGAAGWRSVIRETLASRCTGVEKRVEGVFVDAQGILLR